MNKYHKLQHEVAEAVELHGCRLPASTIEGYCNRLRAANPDRVVVFYEPAYQPYKVRQTSPPWGFGTEEQFWRECVYFWAQLANDNVRNGHRKTADYCRLRAQEYRNYLVR